MCKSKSSTLKDVRIPATVDTVKEVSRQHRLDCPTIETKVEDQKMAVRVCFLVSPTVRINGLDVGPSARKRKAFGMMCRRYESSSGVPSGNLIRRAIAEAILVTDFRRLLNLSSYEGTAVGSKSTRHSGLAPSVNQPSLEHRRG